MTQWRDIWRASWPTVLVLGFAYLMFWLSNANWPDEWVLPRPILTADQLAALRDHRINRIGIQDMLLFTLAGSFASFLLAACIWGAGSGISGAAPAAYAADRIWAFGGSPCARFAASDIVESFDASRVAAGG